MAEEETIVVEGIGPALVHSANVMAAGRDTYGRLAMVITTERPGAEPPCHCHYMEDEALYVLEGELAVYLEGTWIRAPAGAAVFLPRAAEHSFAVLTQSARVLSVLAPAGFEGFYSEMGDAPWASVTPLEIERLVVTAARYGCEITGPHPGRPE